VSAAITWVTLGCWAVLVGAAALRRGAIVATFLGIAFGIYAFSAITMARWMGPLAPLYLVFDALAALRLGSLMLPRERGRAWHLLVSMPGNFFVAATLFAWPWAVLTALGFHPWLWWLPYVVALAGVPTSLRNRLEELDLELDGAVASDVVRPHPRGRARSERPLRIVQITDPHLGPFMTVERLASICQRAVDRNPDLVLLTGDFLTVDTQHDHRPLAQSLAPLRALEGRVFACHGNHDHEAPDVVAKALASAGVRLLVDDEATVETEAGPVQIVGADFRRRERAAHLASLCARYPRREGHLRLVLLHDPGAFRHLPEGEGDLVLSGHTHGGQVGLVSVGLQWTFLRMVSSIPDHGFWARGRNRLYVHRGTGHYGFPLRVGVPGEESLVRVHATTAG
jgi:predicted MPP superfamily phosphohydrolase